MKRHFLLDLDGTLYSGDAPMPHAAEFVSCLDARHAPFLALTNCPSKTAAQVSAKLRGMGISVPREKVLTSGMAAAAILKKEHGARSVFVLGGGALAAECEAAGLAVSEVAPDAVLVGYDTGLTYERLCLACALVEAGAKLFCTNPDPVIPFNGGLVPHTGAIAKAVECATGRKALCIGKPETGMFGIAHAMLGGDKKNYVMLGDRLDTDVLFAKNCGITSWLVSSTVKADEGVRAPDKHFQNLAEIIRFIEGERE